MDEIQKVFANTKLGIPIFTLNTVTCCKNHQLIPYLDIARWNCQFNNDNKNVCFYRPNFTHFTNYILFNLLNNNVFCKQYLAKFQGPNHIFLPDVVIINTSLFSKRLSNCVVFSTSPLPCYFTIRKMLLHLSWLKIK